MSLDEVDDYEVLMGDLHDCAACRICVGPDSGLSEAWVSARSSILPCREWPYFVTTGIFHFLNILPVSHGVGHDIPTRMHDDSGFNHTRKDSLLC